MELLRTTRLLLRRWEESDLPAFYDLYSRDDVMRWLGSHPRRTLAPWTRRASGWTDGAPGNETAGSG
jgi:RimJ/RimL family protein N-acetyltransferase